MAFPPKEPPLYECEKQTWTVIRSQNPGGERCINLMSKSSDPTVCYLPWNMLPFKIHVLFLEPGLCATSLYWLHFMTEHLKAMLLISLLVSLYLLPAMYYN